MGKYLDLGCGTDKPDSPFLNDHKWIGLDRIDTPAVDVVHDLCDTPLPFDTNEFDHVRAQNVLEHLPRDAFIAVLEEIHRITKPGGCVEVTGPHYLSWNADTADHYRSFSRTTFDVFTPDHEYPTQFPDLFTVEEINWIWNEEAKDNRLIRLLHRTMGRAWVQKHVPNAFDEIRFTLQVVEQW